MTDDQYAFLQVWVLPWAKQYHPDWYEATLAVVGKRRSFVLFLLRLAEHRWKEDEASRLETPVWLLELTKLTIRFLDKRTGQTLEFSGRMVQGRTRAIAELAMPRDVWEDFEHLKQQWDLEYDDDRE